jgi:hypothetical protein
MNLQDLQEAYNQVHELDEAEGSYGQTPKATAAYGKLGNERRMKPASEYSKRGEKTKKVSSAEKHEMRSRRTAADHGGKKSTKPAWHSYQRHQMTQSDRDYLRGQSEYGHIGYDPDGDAEPSGPGGKPKGKKAERQKKTGVSAESFNAYELVLDYLLEEGFASTEESADKIILNMSEAWFEDIMELNRLEREQGRESGGNPDQAYRIVKKSIRGMEGKPAGQRKKEKGKKPPAAGEYGSERRSPEQIVKKRREDKKRGEEMMHSRYD